MPSATRPRAERLVAGVFLLVVSLSTARSQTASDADLERIRGDITRLRGKLDDVRRQARSARQELEAVDLDLAIRTSELQLATDIQNRLGTERTAMRGEIDTLVPRIAAQKRFLARRLVALDRMGGLGYLRLLLSIDGRRDPLQAVSMLAFLVSRDARAIARFQSEAARLTKRQAELADRERRIVAMREVIEQRQKAVVAAHAEKSRLVAALHREESGSASRLAELEEKERRLQRLLALFAQQQSGGTPVADIRSVKGALPWPAAGKVVERFGRQHDPKFATVTTNNGVKIATDAGAAVHAVFQGTVLFSQWFKGYGNLIIVDHGNRVFSLYGNLRAANVAVGDRLTSGQTIAGAGESEETPPAFLYFEIRQDNRPEDPQKWLR